MKGKKCLTRFLYLCLGLLLSCLLNFGVQKNSTAIEFKDADYFSWTATGSRIYTSADWYALYNAGDGGLQRGGTLGTSGEQIKRLHLCTTSTIPASSLFSFNISYYSDGYKPLPLTVRDGYVSLVSTSYAEYGAATYSFWTDAPVSGCFDFYITSNLWGLMGNDAYLNISGINSIEFYEGVTYWDIQDVIRTINAGNTKLDDIIEALEGSQSEQERTADAVEEQNQKDDQDRADIEEQSGETEQQGQDASDEANQQGQTLLEAFGSLITAITNIHTTNCTIPNFSIYGLNFQNMDFCQFNVPNGLMAIASIGMVFIFVPLGINLVKRMIALYNEILGGK